MLVDTVNSLKTQLAAVQSAFDSERKRAQSLESHQEKLQNKHLEDMEEAAAVRHMYEDLTTLKVNHISLIETSMENDTGNHIHDKRAFHIESSASTGHRTYADITLTQL